MLNFRKVSKKAGLPPGTLVHVGRETTEPVRIDLIDYDGQGMDERHDVRLEDCLPFRDKPTVTWINVNGIHDMKLVENIGRIFGIHPLVLEDIVHSGQRPKVEDFDDYLFVTLKMIGFEKGENQLEVEQLSLILGPTFVISFQERPGDIFDPLRDRIRSGKGRIRGKGSDYLCHALCDAVVDSYFSILENIGERIDDIQEEVLTAPGPANLSAIHLVKRELIFLRRSVWPLREALGFLERGDTALISDGVRIYLRDLYDHTVQVIDTVETFRDMVSSALDVYLSSVSNKMNEVMKVLTIIATIFIPLTFIAGVYGMNFKYMPELEWPWGYFLIWGVMLALGILMLIGFKRKKWL
jgi:magnesium transporter